MKPMRQYMAAGAACLAAALGAPAGLGAQPSPAGREKPAVRALGEDRWAVSLLEQLAFACWARPGHGGRLAAGLSPAWLSLEQLGAGRCDLVVHTGDVTPRLRRYIPMSSPATAPAPAELLLGQARAVLLVNHANPLRHLTVAQVRDIFRLPVPPAASTAPGRPRPPGRCYGPDAASVAWAVLRRRCLAVESEAAAGLCPLRNDLVRCAQAEQVIRKVAADRGAIGVIAWCGQDTRRVRALAIAAGPEARPVPPTLAMQLQPDYPLSLDLRLFVRSRAPAPAAELGRFALAAEGASLLAARGLITPAAVRHAARAERLALVRTGRADAVWVAGPPEARPLLDDLAASCVDAKAAVRVLYAAADELSAVGQFVAGKELLVLAGPPGPAAMRAHGGRWNALRPERHVLAARAVAIVVHPLNRLADLTVAQLRLIFLGKVADWGVLGVRTAAGKTAIRRYGLHLPHEAAKLFYRNVVAAHEAGLICRKKDTPAVLAAVAMDPNAIAFVDWAELPPETAKAGVKVLALFGRSGPIAPTPQAVLAGAYPLADRLHLYVSPKAGPAARTFAAFILSGAAADTFRRHALAAPSSGAKP